MALTRTRPVSVPARREPLAVGPRLIRRPRDRPVFGASCRSRTVAELGVGMPPSVAAAHADDRYDDGGDGGAATLIVDVAVETYC